MRRNLLDLRSFVIILCAAVAAHYAFSEAGIESAVTAGFAVLLALHTLIK